MTNRERVKALLDGRRFDRLPRIEWAAWWENTLRNWVSEGLQIEQSFLPLQNYRDGISQQGLFSHFGLDSFYQFWLRPNDGKLPKPEYHGAPLIKTADDYYKLLPHLFPDSKLEGLKKRLLEVKPFHDRGEVFIWFTFEGFFWFPRTLFGIENHLYAFYDYPDLMAEMNERLTAFHLKACEAIYSVLTPEFMTFAEDMSYNHGPMISKELFDTFMAPYYQKLIPAIKARGTKVLIDTDGDVEPLIPWFSENGIEGVLPLERQAGVDVNRIREKYPEWIMIGGYDKTIMHLGRTAMRNEFERLKPAINSGRYIPCVDHQTPPDVSLENYRDYIELLKEYTK